MAALFRHPEPTEAEVAEVEARKAEVRAGHRAAAWPRSPEPGVHWDGAMWEAKVRREGSAGRHSRLGRFADESDAIRAIRAALADDPALRPGNATIAAPPPEMTPGPRPSPRRRPRLADLTVAALAIEPGPPPAEPEPEPDPEPEPEPEADASPPVGLEALRARLAAAGTVAFHLKDLDPESARWVISTVWEALR